MIPAGFEEYNSGSLDVVMSNFDHKVNKNIEAEIKGKPLFSHHTAWNFCAKVWWEEDKWNSSVSVYGSIVGEFSAPTLEELMEIHNDKFGSE